MFSLREFIKKGFLEAVGHYPDYWIIINAGGYYQQGILTQEDLAEIQAKIDEKNNPPAPETEPEPAEETSEEPLSEDEGSLIMQESEENPAETGDEG